MLLRWYHVFCSRFFVREYRYPVTCSTCSTSKPCIKLYITYESILKCLTSTPNRCCINIFWYNDITFVILKSAYSADILYSIHVIIDEIIFVQYIIFHAPLVIIFSEIYNLHLGIAGRRRTAMPLPNNITKCTILSIV